MRKTIRVLSFFQIRNQLNAKIILNLIKILTRLRQFSVSKINNKKYLFLIIIAFRSL